jgi:asparagine synthase (glutamine-hydrolysing)
MCGIAGVMFFDGAPAAEAESCAWRMLDALRHRGPDGEGVWVSPDSSGPRVAFAHARLAIIDLSGAGRQPMAGPRQTELTFNGEIFNYQALRAQLADQGESFTSHSDTEVLLRMHQRAGRDALHRLEGMFAFGIWDGARRELLLARDRLGIKPLYYAKVPGALLFASEVRALLASGLVPRRLDREAMWHYLGYQTAPTPRTLIEHVRMLRPGHTLEVDASGRPIERLYWDALDAATRRAQTNQVGDATALVRERLTAAVRSHLVSDVPVGVFLSGGLDSAALVALLRAQGATPKTYTVAFPDREYDESQEARAVAARFETDHTELALTDAGLLDLLPRALDAIDHPSGDGINSYVVSRLVRDHGVKVALSGLGGDEIFGGYPSFARLPKLLPAARGLRRSPAAVRRAAASVVRAVGGRSVGVAKASAVLEGDGTLASLWPVTRQLFSDADRESLLDPQWVPAPDARRPYDEILSDAFGDDEHAQAWRQVSYAELRLYTHDVLLRDTDQMSMAHALEVRVPLLDYHLVEAVMALPDSVKQGSRPKSLLLASLPAPLPEAITSRAKRGFTLPFDPWMRGALKPLCEAHLGPDGLDGRGLFKPGRVSGLWQDFLAHRTSVTWSRLWALVALDAWMTRNQIEGPAA